MSDERNATKNDTFQMPWLDARQDKEAKWQIVIKGKGENTNFPDDNAAINELEYLELFGYVCELHMIV